VKVFDFGLAKELTPDALTKNGMYKLTGATGAFHYMAPEVAKYKPYNLMADCYSFGVLLWEVLALRHPFAGLSPNAHMKKVIHNGYRPPIPKSWPKKTSELISQLWSSKIYQRSDFERIASVIKGDLLLASYDCGSSIESRTRFMMSRSQCSGASSSSLTSVDIFGADCDDFIADKRPSSQRDHRNPIPSIDGNKAEDE